MYHTVMYQVGYEIDNAVKFENELTNDERNTIRELAYKDVVEVARALGTKIKDAKPSLTDLIAELKTLVTSVTPHKSGSWNIDTSTLSVEHIYRNGHWICDTSLVLTTGGSARKPEFEVNAKTIQCNYIVTISSGHNWDGK